MSVSPALQALTISIRNGGVAACELLAHWDFDTYTGLPGIPDEVTEGSAIGVELNIILQNNYNEGTGIGVELNTITQGNYNEGTAIGMELTDGFWT